MEWLTGRTNSLQSSSVNDGSTVDPLMAQMRSVLNLGPRASGISQRRERRLSDGDTPPAATLPTRPEPVAIRSSDRSRWLPAPDEQSHRIGLGSSSSSQPESSPSQPLEQHKCSYAMCAVSKVFQTTELLELVLSFLETKDVLTLRRTDKHWQSTVGQSPQLRLHFFTYAQWNRPGSQFQLLPLSLPGLTIERGEELHLGRWVVASLTPEAARRIVQNPKPNRRVRSRSIFEGLRGGLGSRSQNSSDAWPASRATPTSNSTLQYEDLFITQPPIVGMQAFIVWPGAIGDWERTEVEEESDLPPACAKLSCDAGITLGFLAETARSLLASQKSEPSNVEDARIVFKAIISFVPPEQAMRKRNNNRDVTRI